MTMVLKDIFDRSQDISDRTTTKLMIVACVSPSPLDVEDTLNTMRYVTVFQVSALLLSPIQQHLYAYGS